MPETGIETNYTIVKMRVTLDTNILAYAEGLGDRARYNTALQLIEKMPTEYVVLPAQALGELYRILLSKAKRGPTESRDAILGWADSFEVADSTWTSFQAAFELSISHQLQIWDALILSVTAENRCRLLLSEDMQNGFTWRGVTVVNPFTTPEHPLLTNLFIGD